MRRLRLTISLLTLACGFVGCGESLPSAPMPPPNASKVGPHQGVAYALPDGQGFVEIVNEPEVEDRRSKTPTSIVAYFLGPDAKAASTLVPKDVVLKLRGDRGSLKSVTLKSEPKSGDEAGANRFISDSGPYRVEDLRGDLTATIGANPITLSIGKL